MFIVAPDPPFVPAADPVVGEDEPQAVSATTSADAIADVITVAVPSLRSTLIGTPLRSGGHLPAKSPPNT
jgi:hypothetical protein